MRHFNLKNRPAFTMIELVMVIVVLGILASLAMPRLERDHSQEAADDILSQIRYTQHLALVDDMHEYNNTNWQRKFWRIDFGTCDDGSGVYFRIGSDSNASGGGFNASEAAQDPTLGRALYVTNTTCNTTNNPNVLLGKKYGVTAIDTSNCNNVSHIGFDHLGRTHQSFSMSATPNYSSYLSARCTFTFTVADDDTFSINIEPETGYAFIDTQIGS